MTRPQGLLFDALPGEPPLERPDDGDDAARGRRLRAHGASVDAHLRRIARDRYGDGRGDR